MNGSPKLKLQNFKLNDFETIAENWIQNLKLSILAINILDLNYENLWWYCIMNPSWTSLARAHLQNVNPNTREQLLKFEPKWLIIANSIPKLIFLSIIDFRATTLCSHFQNGSSTISNKTWKGPSQFEVTLALCTP